MNLGSQFIKAPSIVNKEGIPLENFNLEYETIGIMLSDNPLTYKKHILNEKKALPNFDIIESISEVTFGGMIKAKKVINTKKGTPHHFELLFNIINITFFFILFNCFPF